MLIAHLDSDDYMMPDRITKQVNLYLKKGNDNCIIGCNFNRIPIDSTPYYTNWLNSLSEDDLLKHKFRECSIIAPTWIYPRKVYDKIAYIRENRNKSIIRNSLYLRAFEENYNGSNKKIPEDLIFFLDHLESGGYIYKVDGEPLLTYRYTSNSTSSLISNLDLQKIRIENLIQRILD
jgi:hypothetical protein